MTNATMEPWAILPGKNNYLCAVGHEKTFRTNPDNYTSVRGEYKELAALLASDTRMPPTDSNTPSVRLDSIGTAITDILKDKAHSGKDVRRWCLLRKLRNWLARALVGSIS